ncbi:MAG: T9SS type A sorting domain-containing protein [Bacteroidia bacterium]|nr:T9SS type A sorting domain-containing protein [Bacteroidia bacterium]MCZ2248460.1 T9SS type A sorting domain-containing protein [Bacteroidia bacterium]
MKKITFLLISVFVVIHNTSTAQISLNISDFPLKSIYRVQTDTTTKISLEETGPNLLWDFSSFVSGEVYTVSNNYQECAPNPIFPGANFMLCDTFSPNTPDQSISVNYYSISPSGILHCGEFSDNIYSTSIRKFYPYYNIHTHLPLTYGSYDSLKVKIIETQIPKSNRNGADSVITISYYTVIKHVDAWGDIILPSGERYQALRLSYIDYGGDSAIFDHTPNEGWVCSTENDMRINYYSDATKYLWYVKGHGIVANVRDDYASLENYYEDGIRMNREINHRRYYFFEPMKLDSDSSGKLLDDFQVSPNPASKEIQIKLTNDIVIERIEIFDASGKIQKGNTEISRNNIKIDISDLPQGSYFLNIISNKGQKSRKFVKK